MVQDQLKSDRINYGMTKILFRFSFILVVILTNLSLSYSATPVTGKYWSVIVDTSAVSVSKTSATLAGILNIGVSSDNIKMIIYPEGMIKWADGTISTTGVIGGGGTLSHSSLTNLKSDDHSQYISTASYRGTQSINLGTPEKYLRFGNISGGTDPTIQWGNTGPAYNSIYASGNDFYVYPHSNLYIGKSGNSVYTEGTSSLIVAGNTQLRGGLQTNSINTYTGSDVSFNSKNITSANIVNVSSGTRYGDGSFQQTAYVTGLWNIDLSGNLAPSNLTVSDNNWQINGSNDICPK